MFWHVITFIPLWKAWVYRFMLWLRVSIISVISMVNKIKQQQAPHLRPHLNKIFDCQDFPLCSCLCQYNSAWWFLSFQTVYLWWGCTQGHKKFLRFLCFCYCPQTWDKVKLQASRVKSLESRQKLLLMNHLMKQKEMFLLLVLTTNIRQGKRFGCKNILLCKSSMNQLQSVLQSHARSGVGVGSTGRNFAEDICMFIL